MSSGGAPGPTPPPRTPDQRAEAVIADAMAIDVAEQQEVVRRRAKALALGKRYHHQDRSEVIRLQSAADAAERHLAVLQDRQTAWRRDRTFERDLVERVLLMARIADFREGSAGEGRAAEGSAGGAAGGGAQSGPGGSTLAAVTRYLRIHHPPLR